MGWRGLEVAMRWASTLLLVGCVGGGATTKDTDTAVPVTSDTGVVADGQACIWVDYGQECLSQEDASAQLVGQDLCGQDETVLSVGALASSTDEYCGRASIPCTTVGGSGSTLVP